MRVLGLVAATLLSVLLAAPAKAGVLVLDRFDSNAAPVGDFGAAVTRSVSGNLSVTFPGTEPGTARMLADSGDSPTFAGFVYDFSPHQTVLSKVTVRGRNRQVTDAGDLTVRVTTAGGVQVLTQTLNPSATFQNYDFDFSPLLGGGMVAQKIEVRWDVPTGGTGARSFGIDQIDLYEVPEPATLALIGLASSCGGFVGYRRRKAAAKKK